MEAEKRVPVVLYQIPLLPELQVKSLIINSFPQLALALQHIQLRKKQEKFQAFLMVPSQQAQNFCAQKELKLGKEKVYPKKWNTEAQVFIGRIPDSLTAEDIRAFLQHQFGKIQKVIEGQLHQESKIKLRHCYIQFQKDEDSQNCIFSIKKLAIKGHQLRPTRVYAWNQSDETDKKVWMKVTSPIDDQEQLQRVLNEQFRKFGKLRERIRVQENKAIIQYTSYEGAESAIQAFKHGKIRKYEVVVRPYANKDSHSIYVAGLKPHVTAQKLESAFKNYQPLIACNVTPGRDPTANVTATITFGSQQAFKKVFVEYSSDKKILQLFSEKPYLTVHMSAKERSEYHNFRKGKEYGNNYQKKPVAPVVSVMPIMPNPIGYYPGYMPFSPVPMYHQNPGYPQANFGYKPQNRQ